MGEPLITNAAESAILHMHYEQPTDEWAFRASDGGVARAEAVANEKELTRREARRVLDVLYDVDREFLHIELGLI